MANTMRRAMTMGLFQPFPRRWMTQPWKPVCIGLDYRRLGMARERDRLALLLQVLMTWPPVQPICERYRACAGVSGTGQPLDSQRLGGRSESVPIPRCGCRRAVIESAMRLYEDCTIIDWLKSTLGPSYSRRMACVEDQRGEFNIASNSP